MSGLLRPARSTDAGAVGAILSGFIDTTPWMPRIHTRAEDLAHAGDLIARGWVSVLENGGQVAAFLARDGADIHALYVADGARDQGFGGALIQNAQRAAAHLWLWTFQENTSAQRFYLNHGFVEIERTNGAGNDEGLPDIKYAWHKEQV